VSSPESIREKIRRFVAEELAFARSEPPTDEQGLVESGIVDSAGVLSLVVFLEETFSLSVPDDDVVPDNLGSIARMQEYVSRRLEA